MEAKIEQEQDKGKSNLLIAGIAGLFTVACIAGIILYLFLKPTVTTVLLTGMLAGTTAAAVAGTPIIPAIIIGIGALVLCGLFAYMIYRCCHRTEAVSAGYDDCYYPDDAIHCPIIDPLSDYQFYQPTDTHTFHHHSDPNTHSHPSEASHHHTHPSTNFFPTSDSNVHSHPSQTETVTDTMGNHYGPTVYHHG